MENVLDPSPARRTQQYRKHGGTLILGMSHRSIPMSFDLHLTFVYVHTYYL